MSPLAVYGVTRIWQLWGNLPPGRSPPNSQQFGMGLCCEAGMIHGVDVSTLPSNWKGLAVLSASFFF